MTILICIPIMSFHHNAYFQSPWWVFIIIKNLSNHSHGRYHVKFSSIDELLWPWWILWAWWIFIVLFILITLKNDHQLIKVLLQWSISSPRWIFITTINSDKIDEFSSQWWILLHQWICIPMMNVIAVINFHHTDEFSS